MHVPINYPHNKPDPKPTKNMAIPSSWDAVQPDSIQALQEARDRIENGSRVTKADFERNKASKSAAAAGLSAQRSFADMKKSLMKMKVKDPYHTWSYHDLIDTDDIEILRSLCKRVKASMDTMDARVFEKHKQLRQEIRRKNILLIASVVALSITVILNYIP